MVERRIGHLLDLDRYPEAESVARSLVAAEPDSASALRLLAQALAGQARATEALRHAREANHLDPRDVDVLITLSDCAWSAREPRLALEAAERAVDTAPGSWATHYTLAKMLIQAPGHSAQGARTAIDTAERIAPWSADVKNLRGMYLAGLGDRPGAREAYRRALELEPHHALALNNLAALDVHRRPLRSAKLLRSAAALEPQRELIHENISVVAWNVVVYSQRILFYGSFVVVVARGFGAPWWLRLAMLACMVLGDILWAATRLRHLPRGYRQSPSSVWQGFSPRQHRASVGMTVSALLMIVVAFAPWAVAGFAWVTMIIARLVLRALND